MNRTTHLCFAFLLASLAMVSSGITLADAPLQSRLELSMDQARRVNEIQAASRRSFASKRQEFNRESRAQRRARIANDSNEVARLDGVIEALREELRQIQRNEDDNIRKLLDARQQLAFDDYIAERRQMQGSSRDERLFD